jgi:predicted dehydrogenase
MIRFGVIGTNWITGSFLQAANELPNFQLTSVYSRSEEKAKEFGEKYQASHLFTSLEEMAKSEHIDAIYIASPNSFHAEQAILFLKHGKHVLCEKAIASNKAELEQMIQTAKENNVLLMEALKSTFVPNFAVIKENLEKIGQVRRVFASYCQYSSRYDAYRSGTILNAFDPTFSNGALMDIGVYCIYPVVALFGRPLSVKASGVLLESGVDGEGSILLTYKNMDAVLMYSKITNSSIPSEIQGEDGNLVIDKVNTPEKVVLVYRNGEKVDLSVPQKVESMYYEAKEFIDLIERGETESTINTYENSLVTMEIMDDVRKQIGVRFPADNKGL